MHPVFQSPVTKETMGRVAKACEFSMNNILSPLWRFFAYKNNPESDDALSAPSVELGDDEWIDISRVIRNAQWV